MWRWIVFLFLPLLAACASHAPAPVVERGGPPQPAAGAPPAAEAAGLYTVKKGDTLWSIALQHDRDHKDLAAWNNIENPNHITVGQQLRVDPPETATTGAVAKPVTAAGTVEARPLGAAAENTGSLKRQPRGGKVPYSDQALALAQAMDGAPGDKAADKPAEKAAEKTADKPADKPVEAVAAAAPGDALDWVWPAAGQVVGQFVEAAPGKEANKGIDVAGRTGDPIRSAAAG